MTKVRIIVLTLCIFFTKSYSQCDKDECYQHYKDIIKQDKDSIQKVFDEILEKYGDVDKILWNLLDKLNKTVLTADEDLSNLEKDVNNINHTNEQLNSTLHNLLDEVNRIQNDIMDIDKSRNWTDEIEDANKTANLIISTPWTIDDIKANEDELEKWKQFLEKYNETNYKEDIMNIPHSIQDDLNLLEKLLNEECDTNCFNEFHEDLKNLFAQLANILTIGSAESILTNLKKRTDKSKDKANDILNKTQDFLENEKNFKNIHDLTNATLILSEEIEELKNDIDRLLQNNEEVFNDKLKELQKLHEKEIDEFYKKYKMDEYQILLDELEDINNQIKKIGGEKNFNIGDVEKEIDKYIDDLEYYSCILNDCRYRKPAEAVGSFNCNGQK